MTKPPLRVLIGIPSGPMWHAKFGMSLASLMVRFSMEQVPGYASQELRTSNVRSSILPRNRLDLVKAAKAEKADFLLMLDVDHTFPSNLIHRLIKHNKPVVAANCVTKQLPSQPTGRAQSETNPQNGVPVYSDPETSGLERIWRIGTGVMLIRKDVLEKVPHSAWAMIYREDLDTYQGEDWSFCTACEELGIPLYIDHDVSKKIGHEGMFEYTHDFVGEVQ